jgi:hypothetical protein
MQSLGFRCRIQGVGCRVKGVGYGALGVGLKGSRTDGVRQLMVYDQPTTPPSYDVLG